MGSDRIGFGSDNDRFHAARDRGDDGSDSENERRGGLRDVDMETRRSDVALGEDENEEKADPHTDDGPLVRRRDVSQRARGVRGGLAATVARDRFLSDDTDIEEEMMRIDPVDLEWRRQLHVGDPIDAQNIFGNWCPAMIVRMADGEMQVRYLNMNDAWQRWLPLESGQVAQPATKTRNDSAPLRLAQVVEVRKPGSSLWKEGIVVKARPSDLLVRYAGRQQQFDEWMPFTPENVAASGDHIRARASLSRERRFSVKPNDATTRLRVIQTQNPRFQHYRDSLAAHGLRLHAVEGDGNCLFRSVSHQIYADDAHHGLVRRLCMDYMESEKEYFEPYVVGDMAAFLRYVEHKRRDGIWGDDPEIQAMCELYDRPAEVYAYDPTSGFRKLRTFHENRSLSRTRPPIRLSYYGGGHYDSIVSAEHAANIVREPPGEWERRHLEISRRINTREGLSPEAAGSVLAQRVAATPTASTTSSEATEMEQILLISRNEFDAMRSNLDETLKMAISESEAAAVDSEQRALHAATEESEIAAIQAELLEKARQASEEEQMRKALEASMKEHNSDGMVHGDFDADVTAAIQASLAEHTASVPSSTLTSAIEYSEEDEMRRILELSAQEYGVSSSLAFAFDGGDGGANADEMDEIQRAIQASLHQS